MHTNLLNDHLPGEYNCTEYLVRHALREWTCVPVVRACMVGPVCHVTTITSVTAGVCWTKL
ncbi:hypothetical protein DPMN_162189 [Dreissena polymorpha]|uniref:Uncharacterized protein n=1 Tax=Dreissena polymorpha TaxID=45954 RepID=A0A9D4IQB9_DREPO|nr:hypothetical protein DPMN_162189 [Dreissena polymorpha]